MLRCSAMKRREGGKGKSDHMRVITNRLRHVDRPPVHVADDLNLDDDTRVGAYKLVRLPVVVVVDGRVVHERARSGGVRRGIRLLVFERLEVSDGDVRRELVRERVDRRAAVVRRCVRKAALHEAGDRDTELGTLGR